MIDHGAHLAGRTRAANEGRRAQTAGKRARFGASTPGVKRRDRKLLVKLGIQIAQSAAPQRFQRRGSPIFKGNLRKISGKTQLVHRAILLKPLAKRPARQGHGPRKPTPPTIAARRQYSTTLWLEHFQRSVSPPRRVDAG